MTGLETTNDDGDTQGIETPIDVDQAFRDAEYQLTLLRALGGKASRLQREAEILIFSTGILFIGMALWVYKISPPNAKLAIAGQLVDVVGTVLTLAGIMIGLFCFILAKREQIRTQRDHIRAETSRLTLSLEDARYQLSKLQDRSVQ